MSGEKQIFTLRQVTASIQKVISERYNRLYWVQAEMHKLNYTGKGHCYPELVQKEEGRIVAEMRGTIWKTQYDKISKSFNEVVKEPLRDGMSLLFLVKIVFHPLYGMGLEIMDIDPTFALGELQKEREETLKRLSAEGILNANQQLKFPLLPQRIAIISVESSKGLSDFYSVMNNNDWGYKFFFMLFTAQLNGDLAVGSICGQLKRIEKVMHHFDAVAIIRGGGGEIGLSCYNHYELAKAIATFPLPVLTGIGHSTNITVSEMVAFRNMITPTELGDFLLQCFHQFSVPVQEAQRTLAGGSRRYLKAWRTDLVGELRVFRNVSAQHLHRTRQELATSTRRLLSGARFRFGKEKHLAESIAEGLRKSVRAKRISEGRELDQARQQLARIAGNALSQEKLHVEDTHFFLLQQAPKYFSRQEQQLSVLEKQIRLMDPGQLLKRGYTLTLLNGKALVAGRVAKPGDEIETITFEQKIVSSVIHTEPNDEHTEKA